VSRLAFRFAWTVSVSLLLTVFSAGCRPVATPPAGTGAKECTQKFFESIARQDWPAGYECLSAQSKKSVTAVEFTRLAKQYRQSLGFEPVNVYVTACEEHGQEAISHLTLSGKGPHHTRFKDSVTLVREGDAWGVTIPSNFGRVW
jgi:hypothetical protein